MPHAVTSRHGHNTPLHHIATASTRSQSCRLCVLFGPWSSRAPPARSAHRLPAPMCSGTTEPGSECGDPDSRVWKLRRRWTTTSAVRPSPTALSAQSSGISESYPIRSMHTPASDGMVMCPIAAAAPMAPVTRVVSRL
eukprot:scaffold188_cov107-Isochrysis_galbana.AAC.20